MSLSLQQISQHLPALRQQIDEWNRSQAPESPQEETSAQEIPRSETKNVVIAFRNRPMLPGEGHKFVPNDPEAPQDPDLYLCHAISTRASPAAIIAHVPSMKVKFSPFLII